MEMTNCLRYARMFNRLLNCWKFSLRFTNDVRRNKARYCPRLGDYKTKQQTLTRQNSSIELNKHPPSEGWCPNTMPPSQKRSELSVVLLRILLSFLDHFTWLNMWLEWAVGVRSGARQGNPTGKSCLPGHFGVWWPKNSYKVFFKKVKTIHMCYYACCYKGRATELRPYII